MLFEVHYSKNGLRGKNTKSEAIKEMFRDIWKFDRVEAESEEEAIEKVFQKEGKENINYVLSVIPINPVALMP